MPRQFKRAILFAGLGLAAVFLGFDLERWIPGCDHVHVFSGPTLKLNQQVGVFILAASVAPLVFVDEVFSVGVAQLTCRRRVRDQSDRSQASDDTARERDRINRERERAARRSQQYPRSHFGFCVGEAFSKRSSSSLVQLRYQLDPSTLLTQQFRDVIPLLEQYGSLPS